MEIQEEAVVNVLGVFKNRLKAVVNARGSSFNSFVNTILVVYNVL